MSLIKLDSHKIGHCAYTFDNGVRLSVTFAPMTYSDNYDVWKKDKDGRETWQQRMESTTVEIMQTDGNPALNRWIHRKYGDYDGDDDPIGYVKAEHLAQILKRADSKVYASAVSEEPPIHQEQSL